MKIPKSVVEGVDEAFNSHDLGALGGRTFVVQPRSGEKLRRIRTEQLQLTQQEFALQFGIPVRTLQKWEQGSREPEGPARAYLTVIERIPSEVIKALRADAVERIHETDVV